MAAGTAGIWRLEWTGYPRWLSHMLALEAGCQLECPHMVSLMAWVSHSMVAVSWEGASQDECFKRKEAEAARPGKGWAYFPSLLPYSTGPCSHRPMKIQADQVDSTSWWGGDNVKLQESMWHGRCFSYLWKGVKISVMAFPPAPPYQGFANICGHLLSEVDETVAFSPQLCQFWGQMEDTT